MKDKIISISIIILMLLCNCSIVKAVKEVETNSTNTIQADANSDATLKNLGIKPYKYDFKGFKKTKTTYDITVPENISSVVIYANATQKGAKVIGTGTVQLKDGINTFSVEVTAPDKITKETYTLNITKGQKNNETVEGLTNQTNEQVGVVDVDLTELNYEMQQAQSRIKKEKWIISGTIIIIVLLIILYLIDSYKLRKEKGKEIKMYEDDLYNEDK